MEGNKGRESHVRPGEGIQRRGGRFSSFFLCFQFSVYSIRHKLINYFILGKATPALTLCPFLRRLHKVSMSISLQPTSGTESNAVLRPVLLYSGISPSRNRISVFQILLGFLCSNNYVPPYGKRKKHLLRSNYFISYQATVKVMFVT